MDEMKRLYVVVRGDLAPGLRAAQATHAALAFAFTFPEMAARWYETSNNLVLLECSGQSDLMRLCDRANRARVVFAGFTEPDLDDELTAVAFEPEASRMLSSLPLALRHDPSHGDRPSQVPRCDPGG